MKLKKISILLFSLFLAAVFLITAVLGARSVGVPLYKYLKNVMNGSISGPAGIIDGFTEAFESGFNDGLCIRSASIDAHGALQRLAGRSIVYDASEIYTVAESESGYLYYSVDDPNNSVGTTDGRQDELCAKIAELQKYCNAHGTDFLYVTAPSKGCYLEETTLPIGSNVTDYTAGSAAFSATLDKLGVRNLDLTEQLHREVPRYEDCFFRTDHHWNCETAFWGFQKTLRELQTIWDDPIDPDLFAESSFESRIVPNALLGSMGTRVGRLYAGKDDFAVISPTYDTSFEVRMTSKTLKTSVRRTGNFNEAILQIENGIGYGRYISSDRDLIYVDNLLSPSRHKILLLKDSFGVPVSAWLSCVADELWIMDLRYEQEKSVNDFILDHEIDTVVILYNSQVFGWADAMFTFDRPSKGN